MDYIALGRGRTRDTCCLIFSSIILSEKVSPTRKGRMGHACLNSKMVSEKMESVARNLFKGIYGK